MLCIIIEKGNGKGNSKRCGAKISAGKVVEKIQDEAENGQGDEEDTNDPYDEGEDDDDYDVLEAGDMLYDDTEKAEYEVIKITGDTIFVSYNTTLNKRQKVITVPNQIRTEDGIVCTVVLILNAGKMKELWIDSRAVSGYNTVRPDIACIGIFHKLAEGGWLWTRR